LSTRYKLEESTIEKNYYFFDSFKLGFTGTLCENVPTIIPTTVSTTIATTTVSTTTQGGYILCTNQNTCRNQGVCYILTNSVFCVCPEGESSE
jgi:hypothetical protein